LIKSLPANIKEKICLFFTASSIEIPRLQHFTVSRCTYGSKKGSEMSLEVENQASTETTANRLSLKRHDSLFGDAEKVSGTTYHGSAVCPWWSFYYINTLVCHGTV
jgi:hypothetical protein